MKSILIRKSIFFAVLYRSPNQNQEQSQAFTDGFQLMISQIAAENPYCVIITGDFNRRSHQWWGSDTENEDGRIFEPLASDLGFWQLISEPTHLMGQSKSCLDLIFTGQPNLFLENGVHSTLKEQCHHQIVYGKLPVKNLAPRRVWFYNRADKLLIKKSINMFHWCKTLTKLRCPNYQVNVVNEVLQNIFSNFIQTTILR